MLAAYGVDTLDPTVTLRRVWVLLRRLPPGTVSDPDSAASWSVESHLLATMVDAVRDLTWLTAAVNSKQKPQRPKPMHRPGNKPVKGKDDGMRSLMAVMKEAKP